MPNERVLIGQFLRLRSKNPDTYADPLAPGGNLVVAKSFVESDIQDDLTPHLPPANAPRLTIGRQAPPPLSAPGQLPFQPPPALHPTSPAARQPSLGTVLSHPPFGPRDIADAPQTSPAARQPFQGGGLGPSALPDPPDVTLSSPGSVPPPPDVATGDPHVPTDQPIAFVPGPLRRKPGSAVQLPVVTGKPHVPAEPPPPAGPRRAPVAAEEAGRPTARTPNKVEAQPYATNGIPSSSPLDRLRSTDSRIVDLLRSLDQGKRYASFTGGIGGMQGSQALSPELFVRHVERIAALRKENPGKFLASLAVFTSLQLLNRHGKIWNPASVLPPPIVQNFMATNLDIMTGTPRLMTGYSDSLPQGLVGSRPGFYEKNHGAGPLTVIPGSDVHHDLNRGVYNEVQVLHYPPFIASAVAVGRGGPQTFLGKIGPRLVGANSQDSSLVDDPTRTAPLPLVDMALAIRNAESPSLGGQDRSVPFERVRIGALVDDALRPVQTVLDAEKRFKIESLYTKTPVRLGGSEWRPTVASQLQRRSLGALERSSFHRGIVPMHFGKDKEFGDILTSVGRSPTTEIKDDDAHVPLSFTDLRPINSKFRTVYFRPFITNLSEEFQPQWNKANFFGRVDPVATYMSTGRTVNLSFQLHAFSPEDVKTIYQKLNWLTSMVYPEYNKELIYTSGPVVRMRIGDLINGLGPEGARGLPGILENLSFDYTDSLWELKENLKVPVHVNVSLSFTVLHDRPIGRGADGKFGGIGVIRNGVYVPPALKDKEQAGAPKDSFADVEEGLDSFRTVGDVKGYDLVKSGN